MQCETVIVSTCRCGWIALAGNVKESMGLLDEHVRTQTQGKHSGRPMAMSNPLNRTASMFLRHQAQMYRDVDRNNHVLTTMYRSAAQPRVFLKPVKHTFFMRLVGWFMSGAASVHYGE